MARTDKFVVGDRVVANRLADGHHLQMNNKKMAEGEVVELLSNGEIRIKIMKMTPTGDRSSVG